MVHHNPSEEVRLDLATLLLVHFFAKRKLFCLDLDLVSCLLKFHQVGGPPLDIITD